MRAQQLPPLDYCNIRVAQVLQDEVMAHRLGLVPIYADPRAFVCVRSHTQHSAPVRRMLQFCMALCHRRMHQLPALTAFRFVADESRDISNLQEDDTLVFKLSAR